jgi:4-hydroxybenzoate polyprenyltransferase
MNGIENWYLYGLFALFSTFSVYNGQRLIKSTHPTQTPWLMWVQRNEKSLYLVTFASGLLTLSCLLLIGNISFGSIILLLVSGIVSLFYVIPVKGIVMREIPYIKVYLIAFTWAVVLILFPMINEGKFQYDVLMHGLAHAFFVIAVAIPFDIRDLQFDRDSQKTIPQVMGAFWAKWLSYFLLWGFIALMILFEPKLMLSPTFYLGVILQFLLIVFMNEKRGDLYCAGAIDGAIGLIGLSYFSTALW